MSQVNFDSMSDAELRRYFLANRQDKAAFQAYLDRFNHRLIVRAAPKLRVGWDEAFATMAEQEDDVLLDEANTTNWDESEWQW
ncbi:MAG: hypothetical protein RMZ69_01660 [Nostoc sp. ChiQUE01a]|nr:hypothetical protein [Nostoc sp. ChiQUE01a]